MRYLLCCSSKSSKEKNDAIEGREIIKTRTEKVPSEAFLVPVPRGGEDGDKRRGKVNSADVKTTVDRGVLCILDRFGEEWSSPIEMTSSTLTPSYPVRLLVPDQEKADQDREQVQAEQGKSNKSSDAVVANFSNLFRRLLPKWPITAAEQDIELGESKCTNQCRRQALNHRDRGRSRKDEDTRSDTAEQSEFTEIPLTLAEPSLPATCYEQSNKFTKKSDFSQGFSDLNGGQGDVVSLPGHKRYPPLHPGKHLLQPQVLPVFSWSVPVFRTRLAEGGVSFTFGSGSEQVNTAGTSSEVPTQVPIQTSTSAMDTCPTPTPMEVDENPPPDDSLLNHLVQLTNPSPIANEQPLQQLREDFQKQLDAQMQLQQQLIQQEVEARLRQMGTAPSCVPEPEHVMFCEWTLVLRYPSNQKVADRPMGSLGHDPLRNYKLRRRSSDSGHITDSKGPDSNQGSESEPHTEPTPVCPQPVPVNPEPAATCPKPEPSLKSPQPCSESEPAPLAKEVDAKPENRVNGNKPELAERVEPKNEQLPERVEPSNELPQRVEPNSEHPERVEPTSEPPERVEPKSEVPERVEPKSEVPERVEPKSEVPDKVDVKPELPDKEEPVPESLDGVACVKKRNSKKVTIKEEKLDHDYDVF